jgi:hypothetical protein
MAVPHYTYLVLKMPSPAGVLSLQGDLKISHDCDTEAVAIASTNQVPNASHVRAESARCNGRLQMMTSSVAAPPSWNARQ